MTDSIEEVKADAYIVDYGTDKAYWAQLKAGEVLLIMKYTGEHYNRLSIVHFANPTKDSVIKRLEDALEPFLTVVKIEAYTNDVNDTYAKNIIATINDAIINKKIDRKKTNLIFTPAENPKVRLFNGKDFQLTLKQANCVKIEYTGTDSNFTPIQPPPEKKAFLSTSLKFLKY